MVCAGSDAGLLLRSDDPVARYAVPLWAFRLSCGNLEAPEKLATGPRSWMGDDDPPDMRRLGDHLFICTGIRRDLRRFSLWLRRRPQRIAPLHSALTSQSPPIRPGEASPSG